MRSSISLLVSLLLVSSVSYATETPSGNTTTTTTAPTTTSTTVAPTPSTTVPTPVTTSAPVPTEEKPTISTYAVNKTENETCLSASFALQFVISYTNSKNETVKAHLPIVNGTSDVTRSACLNNATELLAIKFENNSVVLNFTKSESGDSSLHQIDLSYVPDSQRFPGHPNLGKTIQVMIGNLTLFSAKDNKSFKCNAETSTTEQNEVVVAFDHVKIDSFREQGKIEGETVCAADDNVNDLVPIAVGCALLALVIIVLIAYFIGRRRTRRLAYQSV